MAISFEPIGLVRTPFTEQAGMPIQPAAAKGIEGTIEVKKELTEGLKDLDGFSHVILIYHLHRSEGYSLRPVPFLDSQPRGLFSTRSPKRPNPIGMSVVRLQSIEENVMHVENVDILDGTPLLDIKPYVPEFDAQEEIRTGWLEGVREKIPGRRSDDRFV